MKMQMKSLMLLMLLLFTSACKKDCSVCSTEYDCVGVKETKFGETVVTQTKFVVNKQLTFTDLCDASAKYELVVIDAGYDITYGKCSCND